MTPARSSARTRRRHGEGERLTRSASSTLVSRASRRSCSMMARSVRSTPRCCQTPDHAGRKRQHLSRRLRHHAGVRDRLLRDALSIGVATGVYAVSFGVLSVAAGFSVAQTCVMSLVAFTGASQFTFVSVMGAGGGITAALPPAVLLAARNGIYALSLGTVLRAGRWRRALDAHLVIDESTAMAHAQRDPTDRRRGFLLTALAIFACWNAGTLAGALAGGVLGDPRSFGLDAIFPAVFL